MLDLLRAMVQKEVSIEVEKLKMAVEKEKEEEVGPPMGEDTQPPLHRSLFGKTFSSQRCMSICGSSRRSRWRRARASLRNMKMMMMMMATRCTK